MSLFAHRVDVAPDPLRVARALAGEPGFAFLWASSGEGPSFVACHPAERVETLDPDPGLPLGRGSDARAGAPRWIGLLPYECRRELERPRFSPRPDPRAPPHVTAPCWLRYGAVVRVAEDVLVVGDEARAVGRVAALVRRTAVPGPVRVEPLPVTDSDAAHRARIERALELIAEGEIYQVNLARRFDFLLEGRAVDVLARLVRRSRAPYAAAFELDDLAVVASSPELFVDLDVRGRVVTEPIKGTRPRGADASADRALARELALDPKEQAELAMVVDVERNDLGRIARTGSVRVLGAPRVRTFGSVHHRVATVAADLRADLGRKDVLSAMLPSGSVTGAPKVRAMEVIAALEPVRRGLYTGAIGYVAHDGSMRLAMAIRTLTARGSVAHYFSGGGIVLDSDPGREVIETRWKAVQVLSLLERSGPGPR